MASERDAFEQAIENDFSDVAAHTAYADWLMEQGDPRGEFIQVQLALEDQSLSGEERARLRKREEKLKKKHERDWLGDIAPVLFQDEGVPDVAPYLTGPKWEWSRGWVRSLYFNDANLAVVRIVRDCPELRLLSSFHIEGCTLHLPCQVVPEDKAPPGCDWPHLYPLQDAPFLPQLRTFQLGRTVEDEDESSNCDAFGEGVVEAIARMEKIEVLRLFALMVDLERLFALPNFERLTTLQIYHGHNVYPLHVLADNPSLTSLTSMRFYPSCRYNGDSVSLPREEVRALLNSSHLPALKVLHVHASDLGDAGCQDIVNSGILKRLKVLNLKHGCIHDEGARILAECPDVHNLEMLNLENNELTETGRSTLLSIGIPVRCDPQNEIGSDEYLYSGDIE